MYDIFYGEISDDRQTKWDNGDDNPYNVLKKYNQIARVRDFLGWAKRNLTDEISIDWGSIAWKGIGKDLLRLAADNRYIIIEGFDEINPDGIYGIVFIDWS